MSKPVKELLMKEYLDRLDGAEDVAVVSIRGIDANSTNQIRKNLREKEIRVTIMRNRLARKAFAESSSLSALEPVLDGPSALVYGAESVVEVARELVDQLKEFPDIELKGAVLDGTLFEGEEGVKRLSKFPTREEAIGDLVALVLGPGGNLVAQVKGPGARIAGLVKTIADKLEKGEEIKAVS